MLEISRRKKIDDFLAFPAIVSIITLVVGVILSEVQNIIGWIPLAVSLGCFLVIYIVSLIVIGTQLKPISIGLLEQVMDTITGIVDPGKIGIIDNDGLVSMELRRKDKVIWLITDDLAEDVPTAPFYEAVQLNLKKGVNYIYFCPRSFRTQSRVATIRESHGKTKGTLNFIFLPDDFFVLTPRLDYTIYDPLNTTGTRCGYMGLPMDTDRHFHCLMDSELIDSIVGRLSTYLEKEE